MDLNKISNFIKTKRKELGLTQEELAEKLFITEKAISRWETGRGTPDISLLIPLSKELKIEVYELLNGEEQKKNSNEVEQVIRYNEIRKKRKNNFLYKIIICFSILYHFTGSYSLSFPEHTHTFNCQTFNSFLLLLFVCLFCFSRQGFLCIALGVLELTL